MMNDINILDFIKFKKNTLNFLISKEIKKYNYLENLTLSEFILKNNLTNKINEIVFNDFLFNIIFTRFKNYINEDKFINLIHLSCIDLNLTEELLESNINVLEFYCKYNKKPNLTKKL